jgi:hypothetical protein
VDDTTIRISKRAERLHRRRHGPRHPQGQPPRQIWSKAGKYIPWKDPNVKFTFTTPAEVAKFITDEHRQNVP